MFQGRCERIRALRRPAGEIPRGIADSGSLSDDAAEKLRRTIEDFKETFQPSEGGGTKAGEDHTEPLTEEEQERLRRFRRPAEEEFQQKAGPMGQAPGSPGVPF